MLAWGPYISLNSYISHIWSQLCLTLCDATDCSLPGSSLHGISQEEYWSGLPFPPPGDLPGPGIEPTSLTSPALAGGFFTTYAPWEYIWSVTILCSRGITEATQTGVWGGWECCVAWISSGQVSVPSSHPTSLIGLKFIDTIVKTFKVATAEH